MTLSAGLLILALSSLSRNSRYIGLFWVGVWFITSIVGTVLEGINREQRVTKTIARAGKLREQQKDRERRKSKSENDFPGTTAQGPTTPATESTKAFKEMMQVELDDAKTDWRPMVSYTVNLSRVGKHYSGPTHAGRDSA